MKPNLILKIPTDEYHAASQFGQFTRSQLPADFRESPALGSKQSTGAVFNLTPRNGR